MRIEQAELRDPARQLLAGTATSDGEEAWQAICEAGWPALSVPEAQGGLEQPLAAACWLYLELGRALSSAPLLPSLLAAEALGACPPSATRDDWLARIAGGEPLAVALLDPAAADVRLSDGRLSGSIAAVQNAGRASHALIVSAEASLVAIVPLDREGVTIASHPLWDVSRNLADLLLSNVALDDAGTLARGETADAVVAAVSTHLHFAIAADSVGAAEALLEQTVAYLQGRRQFDRPLAMFQALKHRCADLKAAIAGAEALLTDHLQRLEDKEGDPVTLARAAKAIGSAAFRATAEEAIQLHGGMGMTAEHPCHLFLKRALLNEQLASPDDACDIAVAKELLRMPRG